MKSNERDALVKRINSKLKQAGRKLKSVKGVGVIVNTISGEITENGVDIEAYGTALGVMKSALLPIAGIDLAEKVDTTAAEVEAAAVKPKKTVKKSGKRAPRENAIIIGAEYSTWTVKKSLGHSRFACVCKKCGAKKTIFSGSLRGEYTDVPVCEHKG